MAEPQKQYEGGPSRTDPDQENASRRAERAREDEQRRGPIRDDEHDGGFGDGPLT